MCMTCDEAVKDYSFSEIRVRYTANNRKAGSPSGVSLCFYIYVCVCVRACYAVAVKYGPK